VNGGLLVSGKYSLSISEGLVHYIRASTQSIRSSNLYALSEVPELGEAKCSGEEQGCSRLSTKLTIASSSDNNIEFTTLRLHLPAYLP